MVRGGVFEGLDLVINFYLNKISEVIIGILIVVNFVKFYFKGKIVYVGLDF